MTTRRKSAPSNLKAPGKALWRSILAQFELNAAEFALLHQLCCTIDEITDIQKSLAGSGPLVTGSMGQPVANPLLAVLANHRKVLDQLTAALALPVEGEVAGRRRSARAKLAADDRWRRTKSRGRVARIQRTTQAGA
jgi:P27 family predicted phage terminase small subunit